MTLAPPLAPLPPLPLPPLPLPLPLPSPLPLPLPPPLPFPPSPLPPLPPPLPARKTNEERPMRDKRRRSARASGRSAALRLIHRCIAWPSAWALSFSLHGKEGIHRARRSRTPAHCCFLTFSLAWAASSPQALRDERRGRCQHLLVDGHRTESRVVPVWARGPPSSRSMACVVRHLDLSDRYMCMYMRM